MRKIGILMPNLGISQLSYYIIRNINEYLRQNYKTNFTLFYEDMQPPIANPLCAVMQMAESWCFDSTLIATSHSTAVKMMNLPGPTKKLYYVYDLEWIRPGQGVLYDSFKRPFHHPNVQLLARNADHTAIIENCFNRQVAGQVDDFKIEDILKYA